MAVNIFHKHKWDFSSLFDKKSGLRNKTADRPKPGHSTVKLLSYQVEVNDIIRNVNSTRFKLIPLRRD